MIVGPTLPRNPGLPEPHERVETGCTTNFAKCDRLSSSGDKRAPSLSFHVARDHSSRFFAGG